MCARKKVTCTGPKSLKHECTRLECDLLDQDVGLCALEIRDYPAFRVGTHMGPLKEQSCWVLRTWGCGAWFLANRSGSTRDVTSTEEPLPYHTASAVTLICK